MKKFISMLLAIVMVSSVLLMLPQQASAESLYIRKIVSVVFDDSGSMRGDKEAFANYAMQTFCGMLNSEDQLYITYMRDSKQSGFQPVKVDLSAGGIQASVDAIRGRTSSSGTPYTSVEKAFDKLKNVPDSNPNTQYWLVVITDGIFDECADMSSQTAKRFLNQNFDNYTNQTMPNGTKPQVTFMGIGDVVMPDENTQKGIFTYSANNAQAVIGAMSRMADRISGRTRLQQGDVKKINDNTIQVSSSIPLLNIAVLAQGSEAKLTKAVYSNETEIPISRRVSLSYPNHSQLRGGAFLIGDSQNVIGAGTYNITFDQNVNLSDVVILFEPALETRMTITLNGQQIKDLSELDNAMAGDKISVSCKVYEMGTDKEVDPKLLPPGTKFAVSVSENGQVMAQSTDANMVLSDYELKNLETEIKAAVTIDGFNPIDYSVKFTPTPYVPKVVYSLVPSFASDAKSVKFDEIGTNQDMAVCFTVLADGVPMTDVNAVKALNPTISVSPAGNAGVISYSDDGKIVFTPNAASMPAGNPDSFKVEVTCTLGDGVSATESYTVLIANYEIFAQNGTQPVVKTQWFGNQASVSFYITKDGVRLGKADVENLFSVSLNKPHSHLKTVATVSEDGLITITPYDENEWRSCWMWTRCWEYMFGISGQDAQVTLSHAFGTATATLDVVEEDIVYILLNVVLPLAIQAFLLWWIITIFLKPRFAANASIYMASLTYDDTMGERCHEIGRISEIPLHQFNSLKYYLWPPTLDAPTHPIGKGVTLQAADNNGNIYCHSQLWYKGLILPDESEGITQEELGHPQRAKSHIQRGDLGCMRIQPISLYDAQGAHQQSSTLSPHPTTYYVHTTRGQVELDEDTETEVIKSGAIFAYAIRSNN